MRITSDNMKSVLLRGESIQTGTDKLARSRAQIINDLTVILRANGHIVTYDAAYDPIAQIEEKFNKFLELWSPLHGPLKAWVRDVDNANKGWISRTADVNEFIAWQRSKIEKYLEPYLTSCRHLAEDLGSTVL